MKYLLYAAMALLLVANVEALTFTLNADQYLKTFDNRTWGMKSGWPYMGQNVTTYSGTNSLYGRAIMDSIGSCSNRIDARRHLKYNSTTGTFHNQSWPYKQQYNTTSLVDDLQYWTGIHNCTTLIVDWSIPSSFAVSNTSFCSSGSVSCYPANFTAEVQNRVAFMKLLTNDCTMPNAGKEKIKYEIGNEWNLGSPWFGNNLGRSNTYLDIRLAYMHRWVNETINQFATELPCVEVLYGAPTIDSDAALGGASNDETTLIMRSILNNFSNSTGFTLPAFTGHLYCAKYEMTSSGVSNCKQYHDLVIDEIYAVCAAKWNATYCNTIPLYVTEWGVQQADEDGDITSPTGIMNLTYGNKSAEAWHVGGMAATMNREQQILNSLYNFYEGQCFEADDEYPNNWVYARHTTSACSSSKHAAKVNYTVLTIMQEIAPYMKSGDSIHSVTDAAPLYGWLINRTNGTWYAVIVNLNLTGTGNTVFTLDATSLNNATKARNIRNGSVYNGASELFTIQMGGNDTTILEFTTTPYDISPPVISGITTWSNSSAIQVNWTTDVSANSSVKYGTTTALTGGTSSSASLTTTHSITLQGLTSSKTYYFNITSCRATGECNTNGPNSYSTTSSGGSGGAFYENFTQTTATVNVYFNETVGDVEESAQGINTHGDFLTPTGYIDSNSDGTIDAVANTTFNTAIVNDGGFDIIRGDFRSGNIIESIDNLYIQNFDTIVANKTLGNAPAGAVPLHWTFGYDDSATASGRIVRSADVRTGAVDGYSVNIVNNGTGSNISSYHVFDDQIVPANGSSYVARVYAKANTGSGEFRIETTGGTRMCSVPITSSSWMLLNCTFTPSSNASNYEIQVHAAQGANITFDQVNLTVVGKNEVAVRFITAGPYNRFANIQKHYDNAVRCWNNGDPICTYLITFMELSDAFTLINSTVCTSSRDQDCAAVLPTDAANAEAEAAWYISGNGTMLDVIMVNCENEPDVVSDPYVYPSTSDVAIRTALLNARCSAFEKAMHAKMPGLRVGRPSYAQPWSGGYGEAMYRSLLANYTDDFNFSAGHGYPGSSTNLTYHGDTTATRNKNVYDVCVSLTGGTSSCDVYNTETNNNEDWQVLEDSRSAFIVIANHWMSNINLPEPVTSFLYAGMSYTICNSANAEYPFCSRRREISSEPALDNSIYQSWYASRDYYLYRANMTTVARSVPNNTSKIRSVALIGASEKRVAALPVVNNITVLTTFNLYGGTFVNATAQNGTVFTITANTFQAHIPAGTTGIFSLTEETSGSSCPELVGTSVTCIGNGACYYTANSSCTFTASRPATLLCYGAGVCS